MPELPEVETTRAGIAPHITGESVSAIVVREKRLRWPVPARLAREMVDQPLRAVRRRAKYLLLDTPAGSAILHLGMSGSLRILDHDMPPRSHDHVDMYFGNGTVLRYNDPRRFGCLLWTRRDPLRHPLLANLGPEPLGTEFHAARLHALARGARRSVKAMLMDATVVVGVGNIYASESLHRAGIHPRRPAGRISLRRYGTLVDAVRDVLREALEAGGTTLRDFRNSEGSPGYFARQLAVYGRAGEPCPGCGDPVRQETIAQRSTFFCSRCQR